MDNMQQRFFAELDKELAEIEERTGLDLHLHGTNDPEVEEEQTKPKEAAHSTAYLNDCFRKGNNVYGAAVPGEWFLAPEMEELPYPTKAAIKRKIAEHADFSDAPDHDRGILTYESKSATFHVVWVIRIFEDDTMENDADPERQNDPERSFRLLLVTLATPEEESES